MMSAGISRGFAIVLLAWRELCKFMGECLMAPYLDKNAHVKLSYREFLRGFCYDRQACGTRLSSMLLWAAGTLTFEDLCFPNLL
jgi:hypothetical protein